MSDIKESYNELSKLKQIGLPIILTTVISFVESIFLIHILSIDILLKLLAIQMSVITIVQASKIRRNKHIYLVTPFTYEEAKEMTYESRSRIAQRIYKMVAISMAVIFIYSMMGIAFRTSSILDLSVIICTFFLLRIFGEISISELEG